MKTIYLVRHGHIENPGNVFYDENFPLSTIGAKQLMNIAEDMKAAGETPAKIISSPYLRTRESAETIAHSFGTQEVEFDDRLIDWQVGDWIGKPIPEFRKFAGYYEQPFKPNFDGLETYDEMAKRVREVIDELLKKLDENQTGIIVGHREPMASAILRLTDQPDTNMREIHLPRGSAWKLIFEDDKLKSIEPSFDHSNLTDDNTV